MIDVERLRAIAANVMKNAQEFGESQGFNHVVYEWLTEREEYVMAQAMTALLEVFEAAMMWRDADTVGAWEVFVRTLDTIAGTAGGSFTLPKNTPTYAQLLRVFSTALEWRTADTVGCDPTLSEQNCRQCALMDAVDAVRSK